MFANRLWISPILHTRQSFFSSSLIICIIVLLIDCESVQFYTHDNLSFHHLSSSASLFSLINCESVQFYTHDNLSFHHLSSSASLFSLIDCDSPILHTWQSFFSSSHIICIIIVADRLGSVQFYTHDNLSFHHLSSSASIDCGSSLIICINIFANRLWLSPILHPWQSFFSSSLIICIIIFADRLWIRPILHTWQSFFSSSLIICIIIFADILWISPNLHTW